MSIRCPHCNFVINLKGAKPGNYHPRCPGCKNKFHLTVEDDPAAPPKVWLDQHDKDDAVDPEIANILGIETPKRVHKPAPRAVAPSALQTAVPQHAPQPQGSSAPAGESSEQQHQTINKSSFDPNAHASRPPSVMATSVPGQAPPESHIPFRQESKPLAETQPPPSHDAGPALSGRLGGYEVVQKLGQGGMGAVYLARQLSLDRNVALKVLAPELAGDPQFVARFQREALAAAQLAHHNVVQIHDIGHDRDINFFSMEFVEGQNLSKLVRENGKVDIEAAVGYTLQAARGLKYAHDHGLIHRDVKPDNLLLNEQGIVKVADLGLVKRTGDAESQITGQQANAALSANQTQVKVSMGTPAYMPPEQAQDAGAVDQRADIYSLGCTLYDLITGRPPFTGKTALEVMTKHQREAVVPPEMIVKNVPKTLSVILMKMMAKRPEDRYQNMAEVIRALEEFLGIASSGPFTPKEEHTKVLEFSVARFNASKWASIRKWMIWSFYGLCALGALFFGFMVADPLQKIQFGGAFVGLALLTTVAYIVTTGITQGTFVFKKLRQLVLGASFVDWIMWLAIATVLALTLYAFQQHIGWIIVGVLSVAIACAFHFSVDLMVAADRQKPILAVESMLKQMRLRGLEEEAIRRFVSRYSGERWEEFYEAMFGYEAKIEARRLWGKSDRGGERPKHAAWRDALIAWIDAKQATRDEARQRKILARAEAKVLAAKGITGEVAKKQAAKNADKILDKAAKIREKARAKRRDEKEKSREKEKSEKSAQESAGAKITKDTPVIVVKSGMMDDIDEDDHEHDHRRRRGGYISRRYGSPLDIALGQFTRLVLGAVIMVGWALWFNYNGGWEVKRQAAAILADSTDPTEIAARERIETAKEQLKTTELEAKKEEVPLSTILANFTPGGYRMPAWIVDRVGSWMGALAGALLLLSIIWPGKMLGLGVMAAAALALFGTMFTLPVIGSLDAYRGYIAVAAVALGLFSIMVWRPNKGW